MTIQSDTRTQAERRYDAERDGTLYTVGEPAPTMREQIVQILAAGDMPSDDQDL
ncbi:MAG TPA: hypothetical protein VFU22_29145 [Roseiflexaceae bacterium]|nr:hypothetical protein [Roseiflexaceae bacterium]